MAGEREQVVTPAPQRIISAIPVVQPEVQVQQAQRSSRLQAIPIPIQPVQRNTQLLDTREQRITAEAIGTAFNAFNQALLRSNFHTKRLWRESEMYGLLR